MGRLLIHASPEWLGHTARTRLLSLKSVISSALPCPGCSTAPCGPSGVCSDCAQLLTNAVSSLPQPTGDTLWLGPHAGVIRRLVHALKYRNAHMLAGFLAQLLNLRATGWAWAPQLVTHVPTSRVRVRVRGYDQARLLATALAQLLKVPYSQVLTRSASTTKLVGLGRRARAASLANALTASRLQGQRVLLVDDVLTTGATVAAARASLTRAGAGEVRVAVVARTAPGHAGTPGHAGGAELAAALRELRPPL